MRNESNTYAIQTILVILGVIVIAATINLASKRCADGTASPELKQTGICTLLKQQTFP